MIKEYDVNLINEIILPYDFILKKHNIKKENEFWGYKLDNNSYFSFFFSVYKKEVLSFAFRFDKDDLSKTRIYVTKENIEIIRKIINSILTNKPIDKCIYEDYIFEVKTQDEKQIKEENKKEKNKDISRKEKTEEALKCHWKLPGLNIIEDPNGIDISTLDISYRLMNALYRYDIITVKQFMDLDPNIMRNMRLLGRKSFNEALYLKLKLNGTNDDAKEIVYDNFQFIDEYNNLDIDKNIFEVTESDYLNNSRTEESINEYRLKGKELYDKMYKIIQLSNTTKRRKDIYIKYYNFDGISEERTLETIGIEYGVTRERIRQLIKRTQKQIKKYKNEIIPIFNEIIGEKQYSYFIEGIIEQYGFRPLEAMLQMLLNKKEYLQIKDILDNCILIKKQNYNSLLPTKERARLINAGKKWDIEEEKQLIEEFIMEKSIEEIANIHQRTKEGIRKRLIRLSLINYKDIPRFHD